MTETFYDVLGVAPDASQAEIQNAYRERIKETHPDRNDDADADRATQRVIEARDVLTDEAERARYDELGHDAYVGADSTAASDRENSSNADGAAARAARAAGWGERTTQGPGQSTAAGTNASAAERRRRERAARERVRRARSRARHSESTKTAHESVSGATRTTNAAAASDGSARDRSTRSNGHSMADNGGYWGNQDGYSVRQPVGSDVHPIERLLTGTSLSLVAFTFFLYPVLLFSTFFPAFPLLVNAIVGFCTLLLIGYIQSQPSVGVFVFGTWSLLVSLGLVAFGVDPTSMFGILALSATWFPFGFSVLTLSMVRV